MVQVLEELRMGGSERTYEDTQLYAVYTTIDTRAGSYDGSTCNDYGSPASSGPRNNRQFCGRGRHDDHQYRTDHDHRRCRAASRYAVRWAGGRNSDRGCSPG